MPTDGPTDRSEADHRIANSLQLTLSMLRAQRRAHDGQPGQRDAFMAAEDRIEAVGRVHALLARRGADERIALGPFLTESIPDMAAAAGGAVRLTCKGLDGLELPSDRATRLAIVVNELILNACKHGCRDGEASTSIRVEALLQPDARLVVVVSDRGRGLPDGFALEGADGMGLRIATSLCAQMDGTLTAEDDLGARFTVDLPVC